MSSESPPPKHSRNSRALAWFAVLSVGLLIGSWILHTAVTEVVANPPWPIFIIVAVVLGALQVLRQLQVAEATQQERAMPVVAGQSGWLRKVRTVLRLYWSPLLLFLSILLSGYVLWRIPKLVGPTASYRGVTIIWAFAFLLYLWAIHQRAIRWQWDWQAWWQSDRITIVAMAAILLFAFLLRIWQLGTIPFALAGDEASQGLEAIKVLNGVIRNPFGTGWLGVPTMSFYYNAITIQWLGRTIVGLRLAWVFVGTATVGVTFLLVRQLFDTRLALITAVLVATYHYHIHYSRLGSNQVADPLFLALSLWLLYRAMDRKHLVNWALTGGVSGLAFYFYAGARLTPVILLAVLAYHFLRQPRQFLKTHWLGIVVMLGGFFVVAGPMLQYALRFPDDFNARLNQVGIIQSGWLEREVVVRNETVFAILFDQFQRAFFAFNFYPDRTVWYGLRQPLLDPLFGFIFLLGLTYGTLRLLGRRATDARLAPMVAWWWGGVLLGGMLTESPPSSQRLITLSIPTCFFIAWMLVEIAEQARQWLPRISANGVLAVSVAAFGLLSLNTYFIDYIPERIYGGIHAELATEIAPTLAQLTPNHRIFFAGAPWMYWGFSTLPYLLPEAEAIDLLEPLSIPVSPDLVTPQMGGVFVFLPQRESELPAVQRAYSNGDMVQFHSPIDGRLMVTLYIVPPRSE